MMERKKHREIGVKNYTVHSRCEIILACILYYACAYSSTYTIRNTAHSILNQCDANLCNAFVFLSFRLICVIISAFVYANIFACDMMEKNET